VSAAGRWDVGAGCGHGRWLVPERRIDIDGGR
jgi:hypothetical protein